MLLSPVPDMITYLITQWFSQSFSESNKKSERPYKSGTITKDAGKKYLQKKKVDRRGKRLAAFHLAKKGRQFNKSE